MLINWTERGDKAAANKSVYESACRRK